jgi:hypothetical protein
LYNEYLYEKVNHYLNKLQTKVEPHELYRAQGASEVLLELIGIKDTIEEYLKDVASGKRQRVKPSGGTNGNNELVQKGQ